ncbi:MAG: transcription repressor NadR [Oscillibacter sp.]|nr:transcription repressor NadR [Oscillibacter sp.]MBQ8851132.1 transcription repressor NadR [Oscillibacter sp.]
MDANQRRAALAQCLTKADQPISATVLANRFSVSRQIIVGDIALLRAGGLEVSATPRGYILPREHDGTLYTIACSHEPEEMGRELEIMVDNGCTVVDVVVEHPVYGQLTGPLQVSSRYDVQQFLDKVANCDARPLADLTGGIHLHTIRCPDEGTYRRVMERLEEAGILYRSL